MIDYIMGSFGTFHLMLYDNEGNGKTKGKFSRLERKSAKNFANREIMCNFAALFTTRGVGRQNKET